MENCANFVYNISMKVGDNMVQVENGMLLTSQAIKRGVSKGALYAFIRQNNFERMAQGVYLQPDSWADESYVLHLRFPNAVFSHDEALCYHDLVDREPVRPTMTTYSSYNTKPFMKAGVKVFTVRKDLLNLGCITVKNSFGHELPFYDLERTICDLIRSRSHFEIQDFTSAMRHYAARTDKNLNRLMDYADKFHVVNILRKYMEVLIS